MDTSQWDSLRVETWLRVAQWPDGYHPMEMGSWNNTISLGKSRPTVSQTPEVLIFQRLLLSDKHRRRSCIWLSRSILQQHRTPNSSTPSDLSRRQMIICCQCIRRWVNPPLISPPNRVWIAPLLLLLLPLVLDIINGMGFLGFFWRQ